MLKHAALPDSNKMPSSVLTLQQSQVIMALAQGATVTDATLQAGIDRSTYYLWLKNPHFQAELNRAKNELADAWRQQLKSLVNPALATIKGLLEGTDTSESIKLKTAVTVLKSAGVLDTRTSRTDRSRENRERAFVRAAVR